MHIGEARNRSVITVHVRKNKTLICVTQILYVVAITDTETLYVGTVKNTTVCNIDDTFAIAPLNLSNPSQFVYCTCAHKLEISLEPEIHFNEIKITLKPWKIKMV